MSITQTFYDALAPRYARLFLDWQATTREQAALLDRLFSDAGFDRRARILDCACGIGTQTLGLAALGYDVAGSDVSPGALAEAEKRAAQNNVNIRDYDALLATKPPYSPPYIYKTAKGQRTAFQTWTWNGDRYRLVQYMIEDEDALQISKFECEYRALRQAELSDLLSSNGCAEPRWLFPEETGFYQPIVVAKKPKLADV